MSIDIVLLVFLVLFISTTVRATFGFGDALIAMPLLSMIIGIKTALPIVALVAIVIAVYILTKTWHNIEFKNHIVLIVSAIAGIPVGLIFLRDTDDTIVKLVLAAILIFFGLYRVFRPQLFHLKNDRYSLFFGFISGILGGAYNTNGPPIVIYGAMRRWEPRHFRTILQGVYLPTNLFIATGHGIAGYWTSEAITLLLICLPIVITAIFLGGAINKRIPTEKFVRYIDFSLIIIGLILIYHSLF